MARRPRSGPIPMVLPLAFLDRQIIDASVTEPVQAGVVILPVLVAVRAKPVAGIVVPFICKANRDPVAIERPKFLDETIVELARPFPREKGDDLRSSPDELGPVPPIAVRRIPER